MIPTSQQQIESIVRSLEEKGVPAAPVVETIALAKTYPESISDFALAVMNRFPKGGTFLDGAFSYMPEDNWTGLVPTALDILERCKGKNHAAESVIEYASLQCPTALHPHLDRIFVIRPNSHSYFERYPWRESGDRHFDFLRSIIENSTSTEDDRRRAWAALCETRNTKLIDFALTHSSEVSPSDWSVEAWVQAHLHLVGFHSDNQILRRICPEVSYHFQFPGDFFGEHSRPPWLSRIHPTWNLHESTQNVLFGGEADGKCSLCGENLHRLFLLDPVPPNLGITGLTKLEIATCLSCLGWESQPLFYKHQGDGSPQNIGYVGPPVKPQFPVGPLKAATIRLAPTPKRWFWQAWGSSNSRENLNRVGGEPCWVQDADYPNCPSCEKVMSYLFQLDSDLPTADGDEWLWGSGGSVYGFWCEECCISGLLWQCT